MFFLKTLNGFIHTFHFSRCIDIIHSPQMYCLREALPLYCKTYQVLIKMQREHTVLDRNRLVVCLLSSRLHTASDTTNTISLSVSHIVSTFSKQDWMGCGKRVAHISWSMGSPE